MPGIDLPTSERHSGITPNPAGSDVVPGDEVSDMEHFLDLYQCRLPVRLSPVELKEEMQLERRWLLWHEFMKEYEHLDAWLRLAEEAVSSPNSVHVTYQTAKEEMKKFERLRREAGPRLIQLDSLTRRNRTLTRLFQGTMQARLLASARDCGRRWDDLNAKLESITGQLQVQWEGFDAQREELAVWLADMDVRLIEVEQLTGNTCEKLRQLQVWACFEMTHQFLSACFYFLKFFYLFLLHAVISGVRVREFGACECPAAARRGVDPAQCTF
uniref:Uncharacterized protein n=1 Tax=Oreochromis niloticus TaxID=8128 RepID=A0A669C116_ORENI